MKELLLYFFLSFGLSLALTPLVRLLAFKKNFVSYPRSDRWHKHPTALLGGVGIYGAALITFIVLFRSFQGGMSREIAGLLIGSTFLFVVGLIDDKFYLAPYLKLFTQIIAGCIALFFNISIGLPVASSIAVPLTLLWIIGVTNAFNLLDNIDGLAAGVAAITSLMLFFSSLNFFNNPLAFFCLIICGATLGFLPYNFNPAKIFMGDSGSMFLGYSLAVISITGTGRNLPNVFVTLLIPVFILSVPIFDTLFVIIGRTIQGRKIFEGGKDHTSHRLVTLGLSQRKTVLLLYIVCAAFGSLAALYSMSNLFLVSLLGFLALVIMVFFGFFLYEGTSDATKVVRSNRQNGQSNKTLLNSMFFHKRRMVEVLLDFFFICIAYYAAYFLRYENIIQVSNSRQLQDSLLWVIVIKLSVFFMFGLYRGVWRYISVSDLLTIFKVVSMGSVLTVLFLTFAFRFENFSRVAFFIDWLLLLFLVSGSRIAFRLLGEFFSRIREKGSNNVLIVGAGDTGEMVIREIKRNKALNYNPVGFIDDDRAKAGMRIQGIPVLGTRDKIKTLVDSAKIKEVIIAIPSISEGDLAAIINLCDESKVAYRKIKGILDQ